MLKQWISELRLQFNIEPAGPLLVKSGLESPVDPTKPDMQFVRTFHQGQETVYLPGSSLKGVIRAHCERLLRSSNLDACNINAGDKEKTCCKERELDKEGVSPFQKYAQSCFTCRLFGSQVLGGRVSFSDAYANDEANTTEQRAGVAIDRVTAAVAKGPFFMEVVTRGWFAGSLLLRNFELWQVGLLGLALQDLGEQRVFLGMGRSRGLGRVRVSYQDLFLLYMSAALGERELADGGKALIYGIGSLVSDDSYQFKDRDPVTLSAPFEILGDALRRGLGFSGNEAIREVFKACATELGRLRSQE